MTPTDEQLAEWQRSFDCTCGHDWRCHAKAAPHPCCEDAERTTWRCGCPEFNPPKIVGKILAALRDARAENQRVLAANEELRSSCVDGGEALSAMAEWRQCARQIAAERDEARRELADLRAKIEALVESAERGRRGVFTSDLRRAFIALDAAKRTTPDTDDLRARIVADIEAHRKESGHADCTGCFGLVRAIGEET